MMHDKYQIAYFYTLAAVATFLLWGLSLTNGTVWALLVAVWNGELAEGVPFNTRFTGIPFVDYPVAVLVAFFYYGTNNYDEDYQIFLVWAYSTLQPAFIWLYVEAMRDIKEHSLIRRPIIFALLWQCLGGAISLPIYYAMHLRYLQGKKHTDLSVSYSLEAKALPFSFLLGAILPAVIGMAPLWLGYGSRSAETHQYILAFWQLDPVWVSLLQMVAVAVFVQGEKSKATLYEGQSHPSREAHTWVSISYLLAALCSALGHTYMANRVAQKGDIVAHLQRMFVPAHLFGLEGVDHILVEGPRLFLKYDLIIISPSSLSWAYIVLRHTKTMYPRPMKLPQFSISLFILFGTAIIGPGAVVSLILHRREVLLSQTRLKKRNE